VTPWIIAGLVVLVIIGVAWGRVHSSRSERRSMENYGHGLAALGDVAKRTGPSASVRVLPRNDTGRSHVRTDVPGHLDDGEPNGRAPAAGRRPSDARPRRDARQSTSSGPGSGDRRVPPGQAAGQSWLSGLRDGSAVSPGDETSEGPEQSSSIPPPDGETSFEDGGDEWAGAGRPAARGPGDWMRRSYPGRHARGNHESQTAAGEPMAVEAAPAGSVVARPQLSISPDELRRQATVRRLSVGSVATLGVLAIVTAGILMTGASPKPKPKPVTASHTHTPPLSTVTTTTRETTTTTPSVTPESVSGNVVTFKVPSGHYTLSFSGVGGACWVGIETGLGSGTYLWNQTVEAGATESYKASGPLAVSLGAPEFAAITVNGIPVKIPKGVTADNLVFASG
jgi:hypothetical protein